MSFTIALAAGGTGGHMFPAEALAQELKRRGHQVILLTDDRGMRFADGFPADHVVVLDAANPNVSGVGARLSMARAMASGLMKARGALKQHKAAMAIGFGGYPSAPGLFAARLSGLPYAVHEQNAILGRVNRKVAKGASFVAHGFPRLDLVPAGIREKLHVGNPIRDEVVEAAAAQFSAPTSSQSFNMLIFGGSQGARLFADVLPAALAKLPEHMRARLHVTQQVVDGQKPGVEEIYRNAGIGATLAPFFTDLPQRMAAAHFVIARSGASSVSELATVGRPSLLVPLAIAMDDHQRANAEVLERAGAAQVILEADLSVESASAAILPMLDDPTALNSAAEAAKGQVPEAAARTLANRIEKLLGAAG